MPVVEMCVPGTQTQSLAAVMVEGHVTPGVQKWLLTYLRGGQSGGFHVGSNI